MDTELPISPWSEHGPNLHTWNAPDQSLRWVFGLQWTATLGRRSRQWLFNQLRRQNVRWYASAGAQGELVGMDMTGRLVFEDRPVFAAAVGYALSHPQGTHLLRLMITPAHQWVIGVHQGSVLSHTDCWMDAQAADLVQAGLEQRFSALVVQTVVWPSENSMTAPLELDFLHMTAVEPARCKRLGYGLGGEMIILTIGALVCLFGASLMWLSLVGWPQTNETTVLAARADTDAVMPSIEVHDRRDLDPLWQALLQLPVDPRGWILQTVNCTIVADAANCRADYLRRRATTDNVVLSEHAPKSWRLKPVSLDLSRFESVVRLAVKRLPVGSANTTDADDSWLTALQRQSAITPSISLGPRYQKQLGGDPVLFTLESAEISLRLPVRQLSLLQSWSLPVFWQAVRLEVMPSATVDEHNSYLMLHLKGELRALKSNAS
uniref:hypothetical protein n=1 Tax=Orrella sp. TaxID=1921583 RepID=UPI0040475CD7